MIGYLKLILKNKRQKPASYGQYLVELIRIAEEYHIAYSNITLEHNGLGPVISHNLPAFTKIVITYPKLGCEAFEGALMNYLNNLEEKINFEFRVPYLATREFVCILSH